MPEILRDKIVKASKNHECMLCLCIIEKGTDYHSQICANNGEIYDFKAHLECKVVAHDLDMYSECDDGLTCDVFNDCLNEYVSENYYDDEIDDVSEAYQFKKTFDLVLKLLDEFKKHDDEISRINNKENRE